MDIETALRRQVDGNLPKVWASVPFTGDRMWLTFYLCGLPEPLARLGETLAAAGWQNTGDAEGGWIYPVIEVDQTVDAVVEAALRVQNLCARHTLIVGIDADTVPMSSASKTVPLYAAEGDGQLLRVE